MILRQCPHRTLRHNYDRIRIIFDDNCTEVNKTCPTDVFLVVFYVAVVQWNSE